MNTTTSVHPSLETLAGLYAAAAAQQHESGLAMARVIQSATRHGYSAEQVMEAAIRQALHGEAQGVR